MTDKRDKIINLKGANSTMKLGLVLYAVMVVAFIAGACTAFAGYILMPVGRFNDLAAALALNGVFDDFSHTCISLQKAS